MYARAVDDAGDQLRVLRREARGALGLAALSLGLALAATQIRPELALPLFVGGLGVGALGVRALWCRWDLLERLAGERDAYVIPEVEAYASREATMDRRQSYAALIRSRLPQAGLAVEPRVEAVADELEALAAELEDADLVLDPALAIACMRLLSDLEGSPLLNSAMAAEDLRSRVRQIRAGLEPRA